MGQGSATGEATAVDARRSGWCLLVLAAVQFTNIVDFMIVMPLGPQLMRAMHIDPAQFGLIVSSYTFARRAAGLLAASLVDRFDRKVGVPDALRRLPRRHASAAAWHRAYATLLAARVVTGAFGGILGGLAMAIVGDVFPEETRRAATGSLMSAFALASVGGVPFGLLLGKRSAGTRRS